MSFLKSRCPFWGVPVIIGAPICGNPAIDRRSVEEVWHGGRVTEAGMDE